MSCLFFLLLSSSGLFFKQHHTAHTHTNVCGGFRPCWLSPEQPWMHSPHTRERRLDIFEDVVCSAKLYTIMLLTKGFSSAQPYTQKSCVCVCMSPLFFNHEACIYASLPEALLLVRPISVTPTHLPRCTIKGCVQCASKNQQFIAWDAVMFFMS